ncbi:MAG: hypothetical protein HQL42_04030 [Alphaproteobacteria bacterium]|nr:hypothetical protein [Alphaproteobacteria bacterium]
MSRIITILALVLLTASARAQELQPIDASAIVGRRLPAVVEPAMSTELPGDAILVVTLPFPGSASYGRAICPYQAAGAARPRIRLRCNRIIPQGYQALRVEAEFYHEDGLVGVPALRAPNGAHYSNGGGQAGTLLIERLVGVERR